MLFTIKEIEEAIEVLKDMVDYGWGFSDNEKSKSIDACELAIDILGNEVKREKKPCTICEGMESGDTLYSMSDWDGGIGFDYIRDIKYCPVCGRKLHYKGKVQKYALEQEQKYCYRNICIKNEYNGIGCNECEVTKSQEPQESEDSE